MKAIFILILLTISVNGINSQDTASYSKKDIRELYNLVKLRNEQPDIRDKINKLESFENTVYLLRKDTANVEKNGNLKPEFIATEKLYLDSMLALFNYDIDSLKAFRTDISVARKIAYTQFGGWSKQLFFILYEKIISSHFVYFKEFRDQYSSIKKIIWGEIQ